MICRNRAVDHAPPLEYCSAITAPTVAVAGDRECCAPANLRGVHMQNSKNPICPTCQRPKTLELQPGGKTPRTFQCLDCDRPDPLKSRALDEYDIDAFLV